MNAFRSVGFLIIATIFCSVTASHIDHSTFENSFGGGGSSSGHGDGHYEHLGTFVGKHELPPKIIRITKTVAVKVPVPYPVKVPHAVPYPVHVPKPYPVHVQKLVKVNEQVPVHVPKPVPYPVHIYHDDKHGSGSAGHSGASINDAFAGQLNGGHLGNHYTNVLSSGDTHFGGDAGNHAGLSAQLGQYSGHLDGNLGSHAALGGQFGSAYEGAGLYGGGLISPSQHYNDAGGNFASNFGSNLGHSDYNTYGSPITSDPHSNSQIGSYSVSAQIPVYESNVGHSLSNNDGGKYSTEVHHSPEYTSSYSSHSDSSDDSHDDGDHDTTSIALHQVPAPNLSQHQENEGYQYQAPH